MDLGINDYISYDYQGEFGLKNTPAITIPVGTAKGWDNHRALSLSALLESKEDNNQRDATHDFLTLYWTTKNDLMLRDQQGNTTSNWAILSGKTEAEKRQIQTALFTGADKNLKADASISLISNVHIGASKRTRTVNGVKKEENANTYPNIRAVLTQLGIKNNDVKPHEHHFHLYLKPPAPLEIAKGPQAMRMDFASWDDAVEDANNEQKELFQAGSSSLVKKKFDKIVSECTMARTYANDSTHPAGTAQGQYAHGYEENQKLKVLNLEVVTKPKYGDLILRTTRANDGKQEPSDPFFKMVAHSVDYIGEDFAEYRVDLSNGKSVLVREYMFWVNKELDSFGGCGASKKQIREMREYQKKHPEEFKKASVSDNFLLSPTIAAAKVIIDKAVEIHRKLLIQAND